MRSTLLSRKLGLATGSGYRTSSTRTLRPAGRMGVLHHLLEGKCPSLAKSVGQRRILIQLLCSPSHQKYENALSNNTENLIPSLPILFSYLPNIMLFSTSPKPRNDMACKRTGLRYDSYSFLLLKWRSC